MLNLGVIGFAQPWLLAALIGLPALYWLLRLTPPAPQRIAFPPVEILKRLQAPEETPARTHWWLLLLRLLIAALVILAVAQPILNPSPSIPGRGPLVVVIDNGWAAAKNWENRLTLARDFVEQADRAGRQVIVLPTASAIEPFEVRIEAAAEAGDRLNNLSPEPWPSDRDEAARRLSGLMLDAASTVWLADGLEDDSQRLKALIESLGPMVIVTPDAAGQNIVLRPPEPRESGLRFELERSLRSVEDRTVALEAIGPKGEIYARENVLFAADDLSSTVDLDLPLDLQNKIARVRLVGENHIGGVVLFDERWRRRTVGIATSAGEDNSQPLLAEDYYVERALKPYAEIRKGEIDELLDGPLSLLVLTDRGALDSAARQQLTQWIEQGGVLLRFAGPKLAASENPFVPIPLRTGDRTLGGALSWSEPLTLQPFDATGPFAGLFTPGEVTISRQVLAQPGPAVADATLVQLEDGTPLVTGSRRGEGWLILFHTTANTSWTNLPLSGLFVDMLRRLSELGQGTAGGLSDQLVLDELLDAFGRLVPPPSQLGRLGEGGLETATASSATPPGLYGDPERVDGEGAGESGGARQALNVHSAIEPLRALKPPASAERIDGYGRSGETDLLPWLLTAALLLAMIDMLIGLAFRGLLPLKTAHATALACIMLSPLTGKADDATTAALTAETRLAYVRTGIVDVDLMSEAGLRGLGDILGRRTSVETGDPVAVVPGATDLALFPLLYWPVPPNHPDLIEGALNEINDYLRQGGLVLFDTGDAARMLPGQNAGGPGERRLRQILGRLDIPPLKAVPVDHTITRSFYLLQDFPGRFTGRPVWVDDTPAGINDGVAGVIIGGHDWAGAWAIDEFGTPLRPVIPGGERQREMARRFGVNIVVYALTGNYKTDQVHVPALLERLGQ